MAIFDENIFDCNIFDCEEEAAPPVTTRGYRVRPRPIQIIAEPEKLDVSKFYENYLVFEKICECK